MRIDGMREEDLVFAEELCGSSHDFSAYAKTQTGYVIRRDDIPVGVLLYCVLWDTVPFMNLVYVREDRRGNGCGSFAIAAWEEEMKKKGYSMVMTSTQADETAQHLYRRLGYADCGGVAFVGTPLDQPFELFMRKVLG